MKVLKAGDKAQIVDMPGNENLIGEDVTVVSIGGFGIQGDDVCVKTDTGMTLYVKEHQLRKT